MATISAHVIDLIGWLGRGGEGTGILLIAFLADTGRCGSFNALKSAGGDSFETSLKSSAVVKPAGYEFDATTFRTILRPSLSAVRLCAVTRARVFKFIAGGDVEWVDR
jgi:hypothetical protein